MFSKDKDNYSGTTTIAEGVRLEGDFRGQGPMVIDGSVKGTIETNAAIEVGKSADIKADVTAASMIIAGRIRGNVVIADRLELLSGARIDGDVTTKILVMAEGAILNGRTTMTEKEKEPNPQKEAPRLKPNKNVSE